MVTRGSVINSGLHSQRYQINLGQLQIHPCLQRRARALPVEAAPLVFEPRGQEGRQLSGARALSFRPMQPKPRRNYPRTGKILLMTLPKSSLEFRELKLANSIAILYRTSSCFHSYWFIITLLLTELFLINMNEFGDNSGINHLLVTFHANGFQNVFCFILIL